jgi:mono/diheme cytochrome c family protein
MRTAFVFATLFLLTLCACGEQSTTPPAPVAPPRPLAVTPPAPAVLPASAETRRTYQWYCAQCHGAQGKGDGINAPHLTVKPLDHTKAEYLSTRTDEQLFNTIQRGGLAVGRAPCMPSWGHTLDEDTIRNLVKYVRELCQCTGT